MAQWLEPRSVDAIAVMVALALIFAMLSGLGAIDNAPTQGMSVGAINSSAMNS
jgi:hypothetical protein